MRTLSNIFWASLVYTMYKSVARSKNEDKKGETGWAHLLLRVYPDDLSLTQTYPMDPALHIYALFIESLPAQPLQHLKTTQRLGCVLLHLRSPMLLTEHLDICSWEI